MLLPGNTPYAHVHGYTHHTLWGQLAGRSVPTIVGFTECNGKFDTRA